MNAKQAAKYLGIDITTIRKLLQKGSLIGEKQVTVKTFEIVSWEIDDGSLERYKSNHSCTRGRPKMRFCF